MALVEFDRDGPIAHVRLNRPDKLNAITDEMDLALAEIWNRVNEDAAIWVCVLSGSGERAFCAGADVGGERPNLAGLAFGGGLTGVGGPQLHIRKPLIAAVHGYCLGGGFELAMCADMIIASRDTVFGLPETRAGIIADSGVVHRVVRRLPYSIAMAMILANQRIGASDAFRFGLVNVLSDSGTLIADAFHLAREVAACSPLANAAAKAAVLSGLDVSLTDALQQDYPQIDSYALSQDAIEVDRARAESRVPRWSGR